MEGKELNPEIDWNGVHQFDPEEVEQVAQELREYGRRRAEYVSDLPDFLVLSQLKTVRAENEVLRAELEKSSKVKESDEVAAEFVRIAREAIQLASDNDCLGWRFVEGRFQRALRAIPR